MTSVPATFNGIPSDAELSRPLGDCQAFSVPFDKVRQRSVTVLLKRVCPSAILRRVPLGIVDAIYGMARGRTRSHISVEILKRFSPAFGHSQALGAIALKQRIFRVVTSLHQVTPNIVFPRFVQSMFGVDSGELLSKQTSTGLLTGLQVVPTNTDRRATGTTTGPENVSWASPSWRNSTFDNRQSAVHPARSIDSGSAHTNDYTMLKGTALCR